MGWWARDDRSQEALNVDSSDAEAELPSLRSAGISYRGLGIEVRGILFGKLP